jgi:ectoine hydroxylase-related dioxygenase (phytanoyl-CoA dioxygenase family)
MKASIFKDDILNSQFERDGYITMPFLNKEEVDELTILYNAIFTAIPENFHSSSFFEDNTLKQKISAQIEALYAKKVDNLFAPIQKLGSSFLTKSPGEKGELPIHADWTVVDEAKYYSVTIWVPLIDTNEENGAIQVLPGSHTFSDALRAPTLPSAMLEQKEIIAPEMKMLNLKAGEAFIFTHSVWHSSLPNYTHKARVAVTYGLIPEDASLCLYHRSENGKLEKWDMPITMFQRYTNIGQRPLFGEKVSEFDYEVKKETVSSIKQKIDFYKRQLNRKKMKPLFLDAQKQKQFEKEGYVVLPALNADEVKELYDYYFSTSLKEGDYGSYSNGFKVGMDNKDKSLVNEMMEKIISVALPKMQQHMYDAQVFTASYVVKEPNPLSVVPVHQDWSFVDNEGEYCSTTCWIPLMDVNEENGALGIIRGSNNYCDAHRASPSPQTPHALAAHYFTTFPYIKMVNMKAGEAIVFNNKTFHASPPNNSNEQRIAIGLGFAQHEAKTVHYYLKPDGNKNKLLKYAIDREFFKKYDNARLSAMYEAGEVITDYPLMEEIDYIYPTFTAEEMITMMTASGNEFNMPLCQKLADAFDYNLDGTPKNSESIIEEVTTPQVEEPIQETAPVFEQPHALNKPFWKVYTPLNIIREIRNRITQ